MTKNQIPKENSLNNLAKFDILNSAISDNEIDSYINNLFAKTYLGLSPVSCLLAMTDYVSNVYIRPSHTIAMSLSAVSIAETIQNNLISSDALGQEEGGFENPLWQMWPWRIILSNYLAVKKHTTSAMQVRGMKPHHAEMINFFTRQWFDMISPTNYGFINPDVMQKTYETGGMNLLKGSKKSLQSYLELMSRSSKIKKELSFKPGIHVATTKGKVIYRNNLIELIQYLPMTSSVEDEPVLIIPSWIMKYYILDLSQHNSLVRWLVEQGRTVFIVSWRNPDESDATITMSDYLQLGIFDSLIAISEIIPGVKVHACGYCLGGTLLSLAAAALARRNEINCKKLIPGLATLTLLAAETDFSEPGEMGILIDEAEVALLEDVMAKRGFLTGNEMSGTFTFLHSRDLFWSQRLRELWLGEDSHTSDLMSWNSDVTRMPAAMHSEYLRRCYLSNEIAEGRFPIEGSPVSLLDISSPIFCVSTTKDHVAPWKSVYKIHDLTRTEITFVLTNGGHNAGIVSEPGHSHRHFSCRTRDAEDSWISPDEWIRSAKKQDGSWWPYWAEWLSSKSTGKKVKARTPIAKRVVCDAPGEYVHICYND